MLIQLTTEMLIAFLLFNSEITGTCSQYLFQRMRRLSRLFPGLLLPWFSAVFDAAVCDLGVCLYAPWRSRNLHTVVAEAAGRRSGAHARRIGTGNDVTSSPTRRT